jgi:endo-1,4-beta-xylanase
MSTGIPSLCEAYRPFFPIGAAVDNHVVKSHDDLLRTHFSSLTCENHMKAAVLHPDSGHYEFIPPDTVIQYAAAQRMKVRGHTLVWHQQVPGWFFLDKSGEEYPADKILARLREHIHAVVTRYRHHVYCWDVVNEAVADSGPDLLRPSAWLDKLGPTYVADAFRYAADNAPDAALFYNDYNTFIPEKRERIVELVSQLRAQDIPVHGIGMQQHLRIDWPEMDEIRRTIEIFANMGLEVQITELDVSVHTPDEARKKQKKPTQKQLRQQAEQYRSLFEVYKEFSEVITGVTFWGVADDHTWLDHFPVPGRKDWPLLFDEHHQPKPAFQSVLGVAQA